jgi:hypothetical protein
MAPQQDVDKGALFRELGFGGDTAPYERALQEDGLSKPEKSRIAAVKRERVQQILESRFVRVCSRGDCQQRGRGIQLPRQAVLASSPEFCEFCGGSGDRLAIDQMVEACAKAGITKLCIVGGSPGTRDRLRRLVDGRLTLDLVEGTGSRTLKQAEADTARADLVVVWGSTELDHKVSTLYRGPKVVAASRRGLQELARAVVKAAENR